MIKDKDEQTLMIQLLTLSIYIWLRNPVYHQNCMWLIKMKLVTFEVVAPIPLSHTRIAHVFYNFDIRKFIGKEQVVLHCGPCC